MTPLDSNHRSRLEALEALEKAATEGPWEVSFPEWDKGVEYQHVYGPDDFEVLYQLPADAALIAAARNLLPALIAAARALEEIADYRIRVPGAHSDQLAVLAREALAPLLDEGDAR